MSFKLKQLFFSYWPLLIIVLIVGFLMTFRLGRDMFVDWDEGLYSVYARTMHETGNFLNNQWNGYQDLQKPPLYTWFLQLPYLFSFNEFSARLINVIGTLILIVLVYVFSKKYFSNVVALLSILILLTIEVFIIFSLRLNTDIGFTLFVFAAFWAWIVSFQKSSYSYLAGVFFALAVMIKGLSIIPYIAPLFLVIFLYPKKKKFVNFFKMVLTALVLILPWHVAAYLKHGADFVQIYLYENLIQRAQNPIEFHYGGRLYFVKQFAREINFWLLGFLVLPLFYILNFKKYLKFKKIKEEFRENEIIFTIALLVIIPFLAISQIQTKLPWYALPISPFLAIFLSYSFIFLLEKLRLRKLVAVLIFLAVIDASYLLYNEVKLYKVRREISARDEVALKAKEYSQKELHYLVQKSERTAKALLDQSPGLQIRSTFVYGGNPNAVYYSQKKVYYYYSIEEFNRAFVKEKELFLMDNKDFKNLRDDAVKILHQNKDFTLFKKD